MNRLPLAGATLIAVLLLSGASSAYVLQKAKKGDTVRWHESCFYYTLHDDGSDDVSATTLKKAIRASFDEWEKVDCSYFYFKQTENASCEEIGFNQKRGNMNLLVWRESKWDIDSDHSPEAMALTTLSYDDDTGRILDADIEFNGVDFDWSDDGKMGYADILNTATHEIGHMLGLEHALNSEATMAATAAEGETSKRSLHSDDKEGVCALYPLESDPDVCMSPYCGSDPACSTDSCSTGSGIEANPTSSSNEPKTGCSAVPFLGMRRTTVFDLIRTLLLTIAL